MLWKGLAAPPAPVSATGTKDVNVSRQTDATNEEFKFYSVQI